MFEVHIGKDGKSIVVTAVDFVNYKEEIYSIRLAACPNASNSLTIRTLPYDA